MKRNSAHQTRENAKTGAAFGQNCLASCQKIIVRMAGLKEVIFHESVRTLRAHEHLLRLALNEAEALAWQTMYPHLIFPTLATEKVQAIIAWDTKRQALQRAKYAFWAASPAKNRTQHPSGVEI